MKSPDSCRHAAASYAHLDLLEYLLSIGGDINITDNDGETPLFTVESIETARHLISKGADISLRNHDGLTVCTLGIYRSLNSLGS
jgi:ankyrin repeat protein